MSDKTTGLYAKYHVERTDPKKQEKHAECRYFVLDLTHDLHARGAALAYAKSVARPERHPVGL
jgi:hypothetical protein